MKIVQLWVNRRIFRLVLIAAPLLIAVWYVLFSLMAVLPPLDGSAQSAEPAYPLQARHSWARSNMKGAGDQLPSLYEYYTAGGVTEGLATPPGSFTLNGKNITIFSGALHYFRVPPAYWRDRLRKMRACGLNAVETYVPWNLHNPRPEVFDFGGGGSLWSPFLDVAAFVRAAQEEDLLVLLRPGPYICSEWEFGGLPAWLQRDPAMAVRTSHPGYLAAVARYYRQLLPLLAPLHWLRGGPIVAVQLENEYGSFGVLDKAYLQFLKHLLEENNLPGLFFTSDSPTASGDRGALPGVLQTANFQTDPERQLTALMELQPDKPAMVMEYWTGWFDHWTEHHHTLSPEAYADVLRRILEFPASVNLYMFHGGTNWGFMNGANSQGSFPTYQPDVSSYDYDAPLSEAGDYTPKYTVTQELVRQFNPVVTRLPKLPPQSSKTAYPSTPVTEYLTLDDLAQQTLPRDRTRLEQVQPMELLPVNNGSGQSYGLVLYRRERTAVPSNASLTLLGRVHDLALVLLGGRRQSPALLTPDQMKGFGYWEAEDASMQLQSNSSEPQTLDILVENWGRVNFGKPSDFLQLKGLSSPVVLNREELTGWEALSLQFEPDWLQGLRNWRPVSSLEPEPSLSSPALLRATLHVPEPEDTFLDMRGWGKGVVFINGFALGRYFHLGPQQTLYLPAPLLRAGDNEVLVLELYTARGELIFSSRPMLGTTRRPVVK